MTQLNAAPLNQDKIIDKIKKLLATATGTAQGGEHERDTAMRMALNLLAKHNLSMADVAIEDKEDRDSVEIDEEFPCPWRRTVAGAIAKLYFCSFFSTKLSHKQKYKFTFVGLESNAITAMEMTKWLIKSIFDESNRRTKAEGHPVAWGTSFRNAAAGRISVRCDEMRAEAETESGVESVAAGTDLVLASVYDSEQKLNDNYIKDIIGVELVTKKMRPELKNVSGAVAGDQYGKKINLGQQIAAPAQNAPNLALST